MYEIKNGPNWCLGRYFSSFLGDTNINTHINVVQCVHIYTFLCIPDQSFGATGVPLKYWCRGWQPRQMFLSKLLCCSLKSGGDITELLVRDGWCFYTSSYCEKSKLPMCIDVIWSQSSIIEPQFYLSPTNNSNDGNLLWEKWTGVVIRIFIWPLSNVKSLHWGVTDVLLPPIRRSRCSPSLVEPSSHWSWCTVNVYSFLLYSE